MIGNHGSNAAPVAKPLSTSSSPRIQVSLTGNGINLSSQFYKSQP